MFWCRQTTSHYPKQRLQKSMSLYGVTLPQWVKMMCMHGTHAIQCIASLGYILLFMLSHSIVLLYFVYVNGNDKHNFLIRISQMDRRISVLRPVLVREPGYLSMSTSTSTLECQIEGQACLFIFHFCRPHLSLFGPTLLFFRGHLAACTKCNSDRPTETMKLVNVYYFPCHLWALFHLISAYMTVIIENQSLLKTVVLQED